MKLFGVEDNQPPPDAVVGVVATADGVKLRYARWPSRRRALGTVCLLEGRSESIERYYETITDLRRRGFVVATFDWRGQGGSDRRLHNRGKGHVELFRRV